MNFKGEVALITGSAQGIGKAIAIMFAQNGADVVVNDYTDQAEIEQVAKQIRDLGSNCLVVMADVSKRKEVEKMFLKVEERFKKIDILVNNAGITGGLKGIEEITEEEWELIMEVNLKGVFNCCQAVLPYMLKQQKGRIINFSSVGAKSGADGFGIAYYTSKAGVIGFSKVLAKYLATKGITVNVIAPGTINTRMASWRTSEQMIQDARKIPVGRFGEPEEVAAGVLYLASEQSQYTTGATLNINGGVYME